MTVGRSRKRVMSEVRSEEVEKEPRSWRMNVLRSVSESAEAASEFSSEGDGDGV